MDELQASTEAIEQARAAAREAGLSAKSIEPDEQRKISYAFTIDGLRSAPDVDAIERSLEELPGVRAQVVYPSRTAWVTAPESVSPTEIKGQIEKHGLEASMTETSLRRSLLMATSPEHHRSSKSPLRGMSAESKRRRREEQRAAREARDAGFLTKRKRRTLGSSDVLYTSRELLSPARLWVSLIFTIPVIAMMYIPSLQFAYWQYTALACSIPVVTWCAWPFYRALVGGVRRGLVALDGASAAAILLAFAWSVASLAFTDAGDKGWTSMPVLFAFQREPITSGTLTLDVACVMTTLLLFGRLRTMRNRISLLDELAAGAPDPQQPVMVIQQAGRVDRNPEHQPLQEVNVGDDILINAGEMIPVDGTIMGGQATVSPGVIRAAIHKNDRVKVNDFVYSGMRVREGKIKVRVSRTGHRTRSSLIYSWLNEANRRHNTDTLRSTRLASYLIPAAMVLAVADFVLWSLISKNVNSAVATALAVLACVAPVALALSPALATRYSLEAAARNGMLLRDGTKIPDLDRVDTVIFNRAGTLTTNEMSVASVTAERGENPELVLRVAAALTLESDHPASRAIVRSARASRDRDREGNNEVPHWIESSNLSINDDGSYTGTVEIPVFDANGQRKVRKVDAMVWRPRMLSELSPRLAAAVASEGSPLIVRWRGVDRGVITLQDTMRDDAMEGIDRLEEQGIETMMISRDAYAVARRFANRAGISSILAGIEPGRKPQTVRAVHTQGGIVAMVGDETVLPSMESADVGILLGGTEQLHRLLSVSDYGVDAVILRYEVSATAQLIAHARRTCRITEHNFIFSWVYHGAVLLAAVAGLLNPMAATLLMLLSSLLVEVNSNRARIFRS